MPELMSLADSGFWWWLGLFSLATFIGSLILMPWLVSRMPADYFTAEHREAVKAHRQRSTWAFLSMVLRSVIGLLLLLAGIAMLVLPGQGILTMLIGIGLMEFPGKFALECRLAGQSTVFSTLNWIRRKSDKPVFLKPAMH